MATHSNYHDPVRGLDVGKETAGCCNQCPWRVDLQTDPPPQVPTHIYRSATRRTLLYGGPDPMIGGLPRRGIRDGGGVICHPTDPINGAPDKPILCCATVALRQRAVLRWCFGGSREPLSFEGARLTIAEMVGVDPDSVDIEAGWIVDGVKITPSRLVELAHPGVFDPNIATEEIPPPTDSELASWGRIS